MPAALTEIPRTILPPPTVAATSTPIAVDLRDFIRDALRHARVDAETLAPHEGLAAQLEQYALDSGACRRVDSCHTPSAGEVGSAGLLADPEADETANLDVLADLLDVHGNVVPDRDARLLYKRLLEQAGLGVELGHAAFDDLVQDVLRLSGRTGLRHQ